MNTDKKMVEMVEVVKNAAWSKFWDAKHDGTAFEAVKELEAEYQTAFNLWFFVKYPSLARFQVGA